MPCVQYQLILVIPTSLSKDNFRTSMSCYHSVLVSSWLSLMTEKSTRNRLCKMGLLCADLKQGAVEAKLTKLAIPPWLCKAARWLSSCLHVANGIACECFGFIPWSHNACWVTLLKDILIPCRRLGQSLDSSNQSLLIRRFTFQHILQTAVCNDCFTNYSAEEKQGTNPNKTFRRGWDAYTEVTGSAECGYPES